MAKCFKKLCSEYDLGGIHPDPRLSRWCAYKNKLENSHLQCRKILKKIKNSETDEWSIHSALGILIQSFGNSINDIYSMLGSLLTVENSQVKIRVLSNIDFLTKGLAEKTGVVSKMIRDLIHVAKIRGEDLPKKLVNSLLEASQTMENILL